MTKKIVSLDFGPLPVDAINKMLDLDLEPGDAYLSVNAQKHVVRKRPAEYGRWLPHVAGVVMDPLYVGDDFNNGGKIELVGRVPTLGPLLVAVLIEPDGDGRYHVASFYPISEDKVSNRRLKKHLKLIIK